MTTNQIAYQNMLENKRHNRVQEIETSQNNRVNNYLDYWNRTIQDRTATANNIATAQQANARSIRSGDFAGYLGANVMRELAREESGSPSSNAQLYNFLFGKAIAEQDPALSVRRDNLVQDALARLFAVR